MLKLFKNRWVLLVLRLVIVGILFLGVGVLVGNRLDWPGWYTMLLVGLGVLTIGWWVAKGRGSWIGPHFFFDLIRLARRARTRDVRMLYGGALLLGLGLVYWLRF